MSPPSTTAETLKLQPSLARAWRGLWLFTWKSELAWPRLPMTLLSLLVLPLLIYVTTSSPGRWAKHHSWAGDPATELTGLTRRLANKGAPFSSDQKAQLERVFIEEYSRTSDELLNAAADTEGRRELVRSCFRRIRERAQPLLNDPQLPHFQAYVKLKLDQCLNRVSETLWGRTDPFYHWVIDFYFFVVLPLTCVRVCGALIHEELQADTLGFLTVRPLSRPRLLVLKFLSQTLWLQILAVGQALLLFGVGALREVPSLGAMLPLFLGVQCLAVVAWSALGTFLGQVTKRFMALAFVYGLVVEMGIGRIPTNINTLSLMRHLKSLLAHDPVLEAVFSWPSQGVVLPLCALLIGTALFLALAAGWFTFKEHHRAAEMQR